MHPCRGAALKTKHKDNCIATLQSARSQLKVVPAKRSISSFRVLTPTSPTHEPTTPHSNHLQCAVQCGRMFCSSTYIFCDFLVTHIKHVLEVIWA